MARPSYSSFLKPCPDVGIYFTLFFAVFFANIESFTNYPLRDIHKEIDAFLKERGILHLDLLEAFTEQCKTPKFFAFDIWHPNPEGHMVIAQQLLARVKCEERIQEKP